ncbi:PepSY-associated TM helix domain-containing protein [Rubripirellula lacrimiformis]|nr:PepSY-associated TM helix domain-containing protein [Rubripirellula lacrimiformis]
MTQSAPTATPGKPARRRSRRSTWLRWLIHSHWMSSAISLVGMILFAFTGITLNHASQIETEPEITFAEAVLPDSIQQSLRRLTLSGNADLPTELTNWLSDEFEEPIDGRDADWTEDEIYVSMPGPGSDAWLAIDRTSGQVEFESTSRGWISYLNDLHKGRHTGAAWSWFIDIFSIATLVFCITGLLLLYERAKNRRLTWPLVALGLIAPWILIVLLVH